MVCDLQYEEAREQTGPTSVVLKHRAIRQMNQFSGICLPNFKKSQELGHLGVRMFPQPQDCHNHTSPTLLSHEN